MKKAPIIICLMFDDQSVAIKKIDLKTGAVTYDVSPSVFPTATKEAIKGKDAAGRETSGTVNGYEFDKNVYDINSVEKDNPELPKKYSVNLLGEKMEVPVTTKPKAGDVVFKTVEDAKFSLLKKQNEDLKTENAAILQSNGEIKAMLEKLLAQKETVIAPEPEKTFTEEIFGK